MNHLSIHGNISNEMAISLVKHWMKRSVKLLDSLFYYEDNSPVMTELFEIMKKIFQNYEKYLPVDISQLVLYDHFICSPIFAVTNRLPKDETLFVIINPTKLHYKIIKDYGFDICFPVLKNVVHN